MLSDRADWRSKIVMNFHLKRFVLVEVAASDDFDKLFSHDNLSNCIFFFCFADGYNWPFTVSEKCRPKRSLVGIQGVHSGS